MTNKLRDFDLYLKEALHAQITAKPWTGGNRLPAV